MILTLKRYDFKLMEKLDPVSLFNENGESDWLLICEHAGNRVPQQLAKLGLADKYFEEHIGYDIGTFDITMILSEQLNATAITCNYSRLVIDCNRTLTAADCIPSISDGIVIPGNHNLSDNERYQRIKQIYHPFHATVFRTIAKKIVQKPNLKIANIHSFTPVLSTEGQTRPWEIGFIYRNPNPTQSIIHHIQKNTHYMVGDNLPYNGFTHKGYTLPAHADAQNIPSVLVEFRQDLVADKEGQKIWANIFADALRGVVTKY